LVVGYRLDHALAHRGHAGVAFQLRILLRIERVGEVHAGGLFDGGVEFLVELGRRKLALRLAGQLDQLADAGGDLLAALMAEFDGAENLGFRDLLGSGFHHHDAVFGACHHDVQLRFAASV